MNARAGVLSYLPRALLAIVAVPLAFVLVAFAAARFAVDPEPPAAAAGAVSFALVVLAPSTANAAVRAALAVAAALLAVAVAFVVR